MNLQYLQAQIDATDKKVFCLQKELMSLQLESLKTLIELAKVRGRLAELESKKSFFKRIF